MAEDAVWTHAVPRSRPAVRLGALVRPVAVLAAALALCWAALANGGAFLHPDTQAYVRGPDVAVLKLLGPRFTTGWATHDPGSAGAAVRTGVQVKPSYDDKEVLAGRSIYYGAMAWLGEKAGGFWLTILVQALAVAAVLDILLRAAGLRSLKAYAAATGLLAVATPAPLFIALVMPDIWAGIGLAAAAGLFAFAGRLKRGEAVALSLLLTFAALAHTSNVLVIASLTGAMGLIRLAAPKWFAPARLGLAAGVAAVAIAAAGTFAFTFAVRHLAHAEPISPPFLTARLVADGTGVRYLQGHCPQAGFEACRYRTARPQDADDYLWNPDPARGAFALATADSRAALAREQFRFAVAVITADPIGQVKASAGNVWRQMTMSEFNDFSYRPVVRTALERDVPAAELPRVQNTLAWRQVWPASVMDAWFAATRAGALFAICALAVMARRDRDGAKGQGRAAVAFVLAIAIGWLANAAICGALSAPYGRYQARLDWILPIAALVLATWDRRLEPQGEVPGGG